MSAHLFVCLLCGSPAEWQNDGKVWRHKGDPHKDEFIAQLFCDKYGYPIPVSEVTPPMHPESQP